MRKWLSLAVFALALVPVTAQDKDANKNFDASKLEGTWTISSGKKLGADLGDEAKKGVYIITKDKITLKDGDNSLFVFEYTLNTKVKPVAIDMTIAESVLDGAKGSKALGIIELNGDELKLTYDGMGGDRPTKFDDANANAFVLKRQKSDKK